MALGDAPVVRAGHGWAVGPPGRRLHLLPVLPGGSGSHPGLGVHHQPPGPGDVLLAGHRQLTPLLSQLLGDSSDVVGQEPTAAPDVADAHIVGLSRELVHFESSLSNIPLSPATAGPSLSPPGADPRLQGEGKLWQVDESLLAGVRSVVGQWLDEQEGGQTGLVQPSLHLPNAVQGHEGVEVAVDADHVRPRPGHPHGALGRGVAVHVALGPDTHTGGHREGGGATLLYRPLHLLQVLEILKRS